MSDRTEKEPEYHIRDLGHGTLAYVGGRVRYRPAKAGKIAVAVQLTGFSDAEDRKRQARSSSLPSDLGSVVEAIDAKQMDWRNGIRFSVYAIPIPYSQLYRAA